MAAWIWYSPTRPRPMLASSSARPSAIRPASHRLRSCSGSGTSRPRSSVRAGRRASSSSIRASRPAIGVLRQQSVDHPGQPDRLGREVGPLGVGTAVRRTLVEDQVEHVEDRGQTRPALLRARQGERGAGLADPLLGPRDALGHRRLRDQERPRDLGRGQAAHSPQGQRDSRGRGQGRVAAHEQHGEGVVALEHVVRRRLRRARPAPRGRVGTPRCGTGRCSRRDAVVTSQPSGCSGTPSPASGRRDEKRLLDGVLGAVEVAVPPDEDGEDLRRELAQQVLDPVGIVSAGWPVSR